MTSTSNADFPTEARVILHGLQKAPDLNGKKGIVRSGLSSTGRHTVYIEALDKSVGLKPSNLKYEPITLESLSVKELKMILKFKSKDQADTVGMEKADLEAKVSEALDSSEELPAVLARAKSQAMPKSSSSGVNAAAQAQAAQQLGNMSPEQLRQQARMMRSMDPAALRRMNPQLANMSDAQIKMAADRMEMMASNPQMMKMAAKQMAEMDPAKLQQMQAQMGSNPNATGGARPSAAPSVSQAQEAAKMMQNMSPEQLKAQAQMLRQMDKDTIRKTNPQMANMTDQQIDFATTQLEMMANNPAMMRMAAQQMANASPEQLDALNKGQMSASGGQTASSRTPASMADAMGDPTGMLDNIDKTQLKEMLNMVKDNPEMLKQYAQMTGMSEEQLKQGVESFAGMDDSKIDAALKVMKVASKAKGTWDKADAKVGGKLKYILAGTFFLLVYLFVRYLRSKTGSPVEPTAFGENQYYETEDLESEF